MNHSKDIASGSAAQHSLSKWMRGVFLEHPLAIPTAIVAVILAITRITVLKFPDDAWVTFLYAQNLADGAGFIFSERYPSWGTTTPLFTLLLASIHNITTISIPLLARLIDLDAAFAQMIILAVMLNLSGYRRWTAACWLWWSAVIWLPGSVPGMEYGMYAALNLGALCAMIHGYWIGAAVLAGFGAITRPDGALIFMFIGSAWLWKTIRSGSLNKKKAIKFLVALGIVPSLWYSFAIWQFGSMLPQTFETRRAEAEFWGGFFPFWLKYFLHFPTGNLVFVPALIGMIIAWRRNPATGWLAAFYVAYVALYSSFGLPGLPQYFCTLNVLLWFYSTVAVAWLANYLKDKLTGGNRLIACLAAWLLVLPFGWQIYYYSYYNWRNEFTRFEHPWKEDVYFIVGDWLTQDDRSKMDFATNEIGLLGWLAGEQLIEVGALVNKESLPHLRENKLENYILEKEPELVVFPVGNNRLGYPIESKYTRISELRINDGYAVWVFVRTGMLSDSKEVEWSQQLQTEYDQLQLNR
jgi:hypothetical protein